MRVRLTRRAGQPDTKRLAERCGENLLCVRYRYDDETERLKAVGSWLVGASGAALTVAALLVLAGIAGLLWSGFVGTMLVLRRTLGPHAFTAIAVAGLAMFSTVAAIVGAFLLAVGKRLRRATERSGT